MNRQTSKKPKNSNLKNLIPTMALATLLPQTAPSRLERTVLPRAYEITLYATPKEPQFYGEVLIDAYTTAPVKSFRLHAKDLKITQATISAPKFSSEVKVTPEPALETVNLDLTQELPRKTRLKLKLAFTGKVQHSLHGLYLARNGREQALVSQAEAADARAIFPCFDEPDFKATLKWTVITDADLAVITNGVFVSKRALTLPTKLLSALNTHKGLKSAKNPQKSRSLMVHRFQATKLISTYLAAVTIGDYEASKVAYHQKKVPYKIYASPGKTSQMSFAQEVTKYVLPWYEKYFGQKYPYGKLDQVAVPGFDAGAMENVGAIFYRANLLLMDTGYTSWMGQKRIAEVIAHEIAHQWFGNLVTMHWWDDLWLNEAFATWIAYKVCDHWQPEWRIFDDFLLDMQGALVADALQNTHPIYTEIKTPAEATEIFDIITYEKGCAVLRMLEHYLGADTFQQGIKIYQQKFKNDNATGDDLWQCISTAAHEDIGKLMHTWIQGAGAPLIQLSSSFSNGKTILHVSQRRFFAKASKMQEPASELWTIPLVLMYDLGNGPKIYKTLLQQREASIPLPEEGQALFVYPNAEATGFYRTQLADPDLNLLLKNGLKHLSPAARVTLLEDEWSLVISGLSNSERFLDIVSLFAAENDHIVTKILSQRLRYIKKYLVQENVAPLFALFINQLFQAQLQDLSLAVEEEEEDSRKLRRSIVVQLLGELGEDQSILKEALKQTKREMQEPHALEPNLASALIHLAALHGDEALFKQYCQIYNQRQQQGLAPELQNRYLYALSSFKNPANIQKLLKLCLQGFIPQGQLRVILSALLQQTESQELTWSFLKEHWLTLVPLIGNMGLARLVEATGTLPLALKKDIQAFLKENQLPETTRAVQKALEALELREEWSAREQARVTDWLVREIGNEGDHHRQATPL